MTFFDEFISKPMTTGAMAPSSIHLAKTIVEDLDLQHAKAVLEYGPGTGIFTDYILERMPSTARFAAIEVNEYFASVFKARHPHVPLFHDTVANVRTICDKAGIDAVDCIVSGLPWAAFSEQMQREFLDEMMRVLKPGGRFVTFAYVHGVWLPPGKRFADLLPKYFSTVSKSPVVWKNVPPAFVYRCRR